MIRLICVACALFIGGVALAQPTSTNSISLQAKLEGVTGGTVNLAVRFYPSATGGSQVGPTINLTGVPVTDGIVSVPVSPINPSLFNGSTRYMGISVNGGAELSPRTLITSVPFAQKAQGAADLFTVGASTSAERARAFIDGSGPELRLVDRLAQPVPREWIIEQTSPAGNSRLLIHNRLFDGPLSDPITILPDGRMGIRRTYDQMIATGESLGVAGTLIVTGETRTQVLQITGGSDIAEPASVTPIPGLEEIRPGMVMVIDRDHDGKLVPCTAAYDRAVAGVISGANDLKPGLVLRAEGQPLTDGEHPLAMTGRVWVWCDASVGAIHRGDSLTTSTMPGHAMVVTDESRAGRAVLGKAMTELTEGTGLVLVLVNLQ